MDIHELAFVAIGVQAELEGNMTPFMDDMTFTSLVIMRV